MSLSIVSQARQISGKTPIMQLHCISVCRLSWKTNFKLNPTFSQRYLPPHTHTPSTLKASPGGYEQKELENKSKGYGWTAPPAQAAKGFCELHWVLGDLVCWATRGPGGGSPSRTPQRLLAWLSKESQTESTHQSRAMTRFYWSSHFCLSTRNVNMNISVFVWRSIQAELTVEGDDEQLWQVREAAIVLQVFVDQPSRVLQRFDECSSGAAGSGAGRHGWATADTFYGTARRGGQFIN